MRIDERPEYAQKPAPVTATADETVAAAVRRMSDHNYGAVMVVDGDGAMAGIMTERDLMKRVVNEGRDPNTTRVGDVMTPQVRVARAGDEVVDWLRQMSNERFRHVPVVDDDGRPLKMMSQGDFVSYTWPELWQQVRTKALTTLAPVTQVGIIVAGVLVYALLVPVVFGVI
ncbi:CBS domain-containing protein [Limimonas halophila]|uniref:CBS domain-containing protein n=1 Tax=Limimonas halophila TaxID=1082479 RepID=A0A1G7SIB0_9PROT|nr:CBS domain-containing protein [Limimonas halophila]SDG22632.1 CBS domain-containing protein [Limimonas halophila]